MSRRDDVGRHAHDIGLQGGTSSRGRQALLIFKTGTGDQAQQLDLSFAGRGSARAVSLVISNVRASSWPIGELLKRSCRSVKASVARHVTPRQIRLLLPILVVPGWAAAVRAEPPTPQGEARPPSALAQRKAFLDPRDFGAAGTGQVDDTAAMAATLAASRTTGRPIGGRGVFRIDGSLDNAGATFVAASSYTRNSPDPATWGFVLEHNSASLPLFEPTACGSSLDGVILYDPRQTGGGERPVVRPPMFRFSVPCVDFTLRGAVVVNAYDLFDVPASGSIGDWRLIDNRIYAVRYVFDIAGSAPEVLITANNVFSSGVFQGSAIYRNGGMLAIWTGQNGAWMHIDADRRSVDGLKSSNDIVYGYRNWLRIDSGRLDVSTVSSPSWDAVLQPIVMRGNAGIGLTVSGGYSYSYAKGAPLVSATAFAIGGSGARDLTFIGHQLLFASGMVMEVTGPGAGLVEWRGGDVQYWGQASPASRGITIDAPATSLVLKPARMRPGIAGSVCFTAADARTIDIATTFSDCMRALDIGAAPALVGGMDTSLAVGTTGSSSYSNAAGRRFEARGFYDKPSAAR